MISFASSLFSLVKTISKSILSSSLFYKSPLTLYIFWFESKFSLVCIIFKTCFYLTSTSFSIYCNLNSFSSRSSPGLKPFPLFGIVILVDHTLIVLSIKSWADILFLDASYLDPNYMDIILPSFSLIKFNNLLLSVITSNKLSKAKFLLFSKSSLSFFRVNKFRPISSISESLVV